MNPRAVVLSVIIASTGSFVAGQLVQAQVDKNTVFAPIGINNMNRTCLTWDVTTVNTYFDGGVDDAGNPRDGGPTGFVERIYGPNVVIQSDATLLPVVPFVLPEPCVRSAVIPRSSVAGIEDTVWTQTIPVLAQQCSIAMTDGGF